MALEMVFEQDYHAEENNVIDWQSYVFDSDFIKSVDKLAIRRFGAGVAAEEACTQVIHYLSHNDWERCKQFKAKSKPTTFLFTLVNNALEEFSRKRYGRHRPPVWLDELGGLWVKLWRNLCLDRHSSAETLTRTCSNGNCDPLEIKKMISCIKSRIPRCGQGSIELVSVEDIDAASDVYQSSQQCESVAPAANNVFQNTLFLFVREIIGADNVSSIHGDTSVREKTETADIQEKLRKLSGSLQLTDEELLLLRLVYVQGLSKSSASKALGLPLHQAGRIVNGVLLRIRSALEACDLDLDDVEQLFR